MSYSSVVGGLQNRARQAGAYDHVLTFLVGVVVVRGLLYALLVPPLASIDENSHYEYIKSFVASGGAQIRGAEASQPPLYYWLNVPIYLLFASQPLAIKVLAMRLMSTLMVAATVPITYATAKLVLPRDRLVYLGSAAIVALAPAYSWSGAAINNDNLAKLAGSALTYALLASIASTRLTRVQKIGLGGLVVLSLGAKATSWPITALAAVVLLARYVSSSFRGKSVRDVLAVAGVIGLSAVSMATLLFVLGGSRLSYLNIPSSLFSSDRIAAFIEKLDPAPFILQFKSFWLAVWPNIQPPGWLYLPFVALSTLSLIGLLVLLVRVRSHSHHSRGASPSRKTAQQFLILVACIALEFALSLAYYYHGNTVLSPGPRKFGWDDSLWLMHGRFLYPAMTSISFFMMLGFSVFCRSLGKYRNVAFPTLVVMLAGADMISMSIVLVGYSSW